MKIRNDTGSDFYLFRLHIADGATVEVPEDLEPEKRERLVRQFTVLDDSETEASAVAPEPGPSETAEDAVPAYADMTISDLRDIAKGRDMTGIWGLSKAALIDRLEDYDGGWRDEE